VAGWLAVVMHKQYVLYGDKEECDELEGEEEKTV